MIGIGLWDERDITAKGLEAVRLCDYVYLESYTSKLNVEVGELQEYYGKKVIIADRQMVEENADEILERAKGHDVALLVIGDVFSATTHTDLKLRAFKKGIVVKVIHNASVLTAVGDTGLELYKFGRVTTIPFVNDNVISPVSVFHENHERGLHTLFLLDIKVDEGKYMTVQDAVNYLRSHDVSDRMAVACAGLGSLEPEIAYAKLSELPKFEKLPQCLIIPGEVHFMEEEALKLYS